MSAATVRPQRWKYVLGALLALAVLVPLWMMFVMTVIQPPPLMTENQTMGARVLWWVAGPVLAVSVIAGWRWHAAAQTASLSGNEQAPAPSATVSAATDAAEQARHEYVLEVIALGVTLDKYRQGKLWDALRQGSAQASIREQDPEKYPWARNDKRGQEGGRVNDALSNGTDYLPSDWGVPCFYAGWDSPPKPLNNDMAVIGDPSGNGTDQVFIAADGELSERPDSVIQRAFDFFDQHPDVPYVIVSSNDGLGYRNLQRPKGSPPLIRDGYYIPEMPDSAALLVLARRERVDKIRPWVYEDVDYKQMLSDEFNAKVLPSKSLALMSVCLRRTRKATPISRPSRSGWPRRPSWRSPSSSTPGTSRLQTQWVFASIRQRTFERHPGFRFLGPSCSWNCSIGCPRWAISTARCT